MSENKKAQEQAITLDIHYLKLLSRLFPTVAAASTEIINLEAILNLPKGTEHFLTDIHGEYEAFQHVLKNASGSIKRKVNDIFGNTLRESEKKALCTLIYYPQEKLQIVKEQEKDMNDWYLTTLNKLVSVCQNVSSKYTRSKVRKSLPEEFSYIIQELLHETVDDQNKQGYITQIINTIISTQRADNELLFIFCDRKECFTHQLHFPFIIGKSGRIAQRRRRVQNDFRSIRQFDRSSHSRICPDFHHMYLFFILVPIKDRPRYHQRDE